MILIGQYDSPFVRRIGIALTLYSHSFEHRPWSAFGDADKIEPFNPLRRVPVLILDEGEIIIESAHALDWLDERAREKDEAMPLIAAFGPERQKQLYCIALASGLSDKANALFYEQVLHERPSPVWLERCRTQIGATLDLLEEIRAAAQTRWLLGDDLTHADIALACSLRHASEAHPWIDLNLWPSLARHSARCEQMDVFQVVSQPLIGPNTGA